MVRITPAGAAASGAGGHGSHDDDESTTLTTTAAAGGSKISSRPKSASSTLSLAELAYTVPMRLTASERALLTVLEQTLHVSEYTDHVDVTASAISRRGGVKTRRILDGILEACHIATGLTTTSGATIFNSTTTTTIDGDTPQQNGEATSNGHIARKKKKRQLAKLKGGGGKNKRGLADKNGKHKKAAATTTTSSTSSQQWASRNVEQNAQLFQTMFEIGRRNKVLNPASMRTTYGKLMYLLQDAQNPTVAKSLGFSLHKELLLVGPFLEAGGCKDLLTDPRLECAVQYIADRDPISGERYNRDHVQALVQGKRKVMEDLIETYATTTAGNTSTTTTTTEPQDPKPTSNSSSRLSPEEVRRAIESLADAIAYIESNVRPVQRMLRYLEDNFSPEHHMKGFSLTLKAGRSASSSSYYGGSSYARYGLSAYSSSNSEGPTLSHTHSEQFTFVWQSLRLWSKVMRNMHRLWVCADDDLLSTTCSYHLYNTGQGLNRVQQCPRVRKVMSHLLQQTQQEAGRAWVGLSVIHLGDRDVPNALVFIDKYTQIPRFLNPIVHFLQSLPELCQDPRMDAYIRDQFESADTLKMMVLQDYFKHGFDGSGDDGGSCIDGRLTSSWNWTSRIAKKPYYHALMLTGFQGFDGDFR